MPGLLPRLADPAPSCLLGASRRSEGITERLQAFIPGGVSAQIPPPGSCLGEVISGLVVPSLPAAKPAKRIQRLRAKAVVLGVGRPSRQRGRQQLVGLFQTAVVGADLAEIQQKLRLSASILELPHWLWRRSSKSANSKASSKAGVALAGWPRYR